MKLIKTVTDNYILVDATKEFHGEGYLLGTTTVSDAPRLSLKNCQAIERGYDLYELKKHSEWKQKASMYDTHIQYLLEKAFDEGFQKALSILGDKKFSEVDLEKSIIWSHDKSTEGVYLSRLPITDFIQSLQQTEWDVEIVTITRMENGKSGLDAPVERPKLDADGCLILKRKSE